MLSFNNRLFTLALFVQCALFGVVHADYPGGNQFDIWTSSAAVSCPSGYDLCATLEFCVGSGGVYGYRLPSTSGCTSPGPLIRLQKGKKYQLTLHNTASSAGVFTNLHTHGLHIVGSGNSDDITRSVGGGDCLDYEWDIPSDHPSGTYWYHAHVHEHTEELVAGGAFGMLIVDGSETPFTGASNELLLQITKDGTNINSNGQSGPETLPITAGMWYRLRVLTVDAKARPSDLEFIGANCQVWKVASDGIWSRTAVQGTIFELTGASRADFAVACESGTMGIEYGRRKAADITVVDYSVWNIPSFTYSAPALPDSLKDIDTATNIPAANQEESISMSGGQISGFSWNPDEYLNPNVAWNEVHEWTLSGTGAHPFHFHCYHMLVVENDCGPHKVGEFYDTISASGDCKVRFKTADFGQRCVLHCHVLSHEDNGAMTSIKVAGPGMPMNTASGDPKSCPSGGPSPTPPAPTPASTTPAPTPTSCVPTGDACSENTDCCSGECSNGKPSTRTCQQAARFLRAGSEA